MDYKRLQKSTKVGHRLQSLLIDYKDYKKVRHRLQSLLMPLFTVIDIYLSVLLLAKGHSKTTCPIHPIEGRYLMGKWLEYVQKYCRDHVPFLVWGILYKGEQQRPKSTQGAHFRDFCLHLFV